MWLMEYSSKNFLLYALWGGDKQLLFHWHLGVVLKIEFLQWERLLVIC